MLPAGFEPTIPASDRSQTHAISSLLRANISVFLLFSFDTVGICFFAFEVQDYIPYQHKPTDKIMITTHPAEHRLGGYF